jgi:superfamily II DNA or RNA helicase
MNPLQNFYNLMRKHQKKAIDAISVSTKGQVILPTACGKTWVQVYAILSTLLSVETGVAVIASHRLLLCEQLIKDVLKRAFEYGLKFDVITVASDGVDIEDVARLKEGCQELLRSCRVERTTVMEDIKKFTEDAKMLGRHVLVVSTYQSIQRIAGIPVDIGCMDEAHVTTEEDKHKNLKSVIEQFKKVFFFTATPVHGCNGRGMDNHGFYGPELISVAPKEAIDSGDILPPIVHAVLLDKGKPSEHSVIKIAYKAHREKVLEYGGTKIGPKLLVSVAGVEKMVDLIKNASFNKWAIRSGVQVITFSSSMGYYVNGLDVTRKEALDRLRALADEDSAIILHYDILTEGIDLPNITGILPLRELCKVKFLQTAGRAARLQHEDRNLVYSDLTARTMIDSNGQVVLSGRLLKPVFWVIQNPLLNEHAIGTNLGLVEIIREAYHVDPEIRNQPPTSTTSTEEESGTVLKPEVLTDSEARHAKYSHEFEALLFSELTTEEQAATLDEILTTLEGVPTNVEVPEIKISENTTSTPVLDINTIGALNSHTKHHGSWSCRYDKILGICGS